MPRSSHQAALPFAASSQPQQSSKSKSKSRTFAEQNGESARIILSAPERYGAAMVEWANKVVTSQENDRWRAEKERSR